MESYHRGSPNTGEHISWNRGEAPRSQNGNNTNPHSCTGQSQRQEEGSMWWLITHHKHRRLQLTGRDRAGEGTKEGEPGKKRLLRF